MKLNNENEMSKKIISKMKYPKPNLQKIKYQKLKH